MNEFESDWNSLSQSFVQNGWIQDGRVQDGCYHQVEVEWMSFSQIELVWVRGLSKMVESKMAELKMNSWLPSSSWFRMNEWSFFWKMVECKMAEFKMAAIIKLSGNEGVWVKSFCQRIQDKDGCHHQAWRISLSQIELVWVRVLCKMAACKMAELKMAEFKMAAIISWELVWLNQSEWVWVSFLSESEFKMEDGCHHQWVWVRLSLSRRCAKCLSRMPSSTWQNSRWLPRWQNSRWLPSSSSEWMSWVRMNKWSQSFVQNGWIQDGQNSRWLPSSSWLRMN